MSALEVPLLNIRLEKKGQDTWAIVSVDTGAVLATRRWAHAYQAVNWCRAVMSSFHQNYSLEIVDGK